MKTILLSTALLMATLTTNSQTAKQVLLTTKQASSQSAINADWLSAAQNNIAEEEYYFQLKNGSSADIFYAANRQHRVGFCY